ncbi:MAG: dethiobiotin synthase [Gammaproteobacteria bacterium HGW-Gammaproteobacteria-3]|nr:MAG: dethiobiotin synthase [Gammaproteobacteria bacterium HGW-Gammaproteobacteria-3]
MSFFITGTDTGAGKTWATVALMRYFKAQGKTVIGMKPVASGCNEIDGDLKNQDALLLQENASVYLPYATVNPYAYREPVSPHLAGVGNPVDVDNIRRIFLQLQNAADVVFVEGAGGWLAPINAHCDIADLARSLGVPVLMVVAIRLGCINHAKLTYRAIQASGLACAGWLAVCPDAKMTRKDENIETLQAFIDAPLLGVLPFQAPADFDVLARHINYPVKSS